jgi:hypothetical protein
MSTYQCLKGCRDPKAKDGLMWHYSVNECQFEEYNPKLSPGRAGHMKAKNHPGTPAKPAQPPTTSPAPRANLKVSGETISFTDRPADVTKGASKPLEPVAVDYILDGPHVLAIWNFGLRVVYFIHVRVDEWVFDWHQHMPEKQFVLTKNAELSISMDPRNFYARAATWFTKNICQAKNLQSAQAAVDGILFFEAFGGIFVAVIVHYEYVYKHSPKLKEKREAKAKAKAARAAQVVVTPTGATNSLGQPVYAATVGGTTA